MHGFLISRLGNTHKPVSALKPECVFRVFLALEQV